MLVVAIYEAALHTAKEPREFKPSSSIVVIDNLLDLPSIKMSAAFGYDDVIPAERTLAEGESSSYRFERGHA